MELPAGTLPEIRKDGASSAASVNIREARDEMVREKRGCEEATAAQARQCGKRGRHVCDTGPIDGRSFAKTMPTLSSPGLCDKADPGILDSLKRLCRLWKVPGWHDFARKDDFAP